MAEVSGDSGSGHDVVESQLGNQTAPLQQQRHGLTNATCSPHHCDTVATLHGRGERFIFKTVVLGFSFHLVSPYFSPIEKFSYQQNQGNVYMMS